jgi:hypothetical protein
MFQFENAFRPDSFIDGGDHMQLVVRVNVPLNPNAVWLFRVGEKIPAI